MGDLRRRILKKIIIRKMRKYLHWRCVSKFSERLQSVLSCVLFWINSGFQSLVTILQQCEKEESIRNTNDFWPLKCK
jgi:hypothetical protein